MIPTKVVVIGAGSVSFGLKTLASLIRSERLRGSQLVLVDQNPRVLEQVERVATRLNREWSAGKTIATSESYTDVLDGASFVILSIETGGRTNLWRSDYEIPLQFGVRQPYAENGGPGGFAHAARNIGPVMKIARAMERSCPQALMISFSNPMSRICDAVARYSRIRVAGLCHQLHMGYGMVGLVLAKDLGLKAPEGFINTTATPSLIPIHLATAQQAMERVDILAAGLNHFTWMLDLRDKKTGQDLYPLFRQRWSNYSPSFEPLTRRLFSSFGLFPVPGDEHACEYVPWVSHPVTRPWEKLDLSLFDWDLWDKVRAERQAELARVGDGDISSESLRDADSEGALEIIEAVAAGGTHYRQAVNLPNEGFISNLPNHAIVEVPALASGAGVHGLSLGALPEGIAELCRREITATRLCVDAAVNGDRRAALQCLLLDPVITDMDTAQQVLDAYLAEYREYLPQFAAS